MDTGEFSALFGSVSPRFRSRAVRNGLEAVSLPRLGEPRGATTPWRSIGSHLPTFGRTGFLSFLHIQPPCHANSRRPCPTRAAPRRGWTRCHSAGTISPQSWPASCDRNGRCGAANCNPSANRTSRLLHQQRVTCRVQRRPASTHRRLQRCDPGQGDCG
jgi:hypothetical protein